MRPGRRLSARMRQSCVRTCHSHQRPKELSANVPSELSGRGFSRVSEKVECTDLPDFISSFRVAPELRALPANVCPVLCDLANWRRHVTGPLCNVFVYRSSYL
jgi:hypothetical protein